MSHSGLAATSGTVGPFVQRPPKSPVMYANSGVSRMGNSQLAGACSFSFRPTMAMCPSHRCEHVDYAAVGSEADPINPGGYGLIAPGLLLRRRRRDTPLSATDLARRRIDPSTQSGGLNHGRKPGTVTGVAFYFDGSCFLLSHAAGRIISCRSRANTIEAENFVKLHRTLTCKIKLTPFGLESAHTWSATVAARLSSPESLARLKY